jgi:hypothetical protein
VTLYRARGNEIVNEAGAQIAVVLPSNCTKKLARELAAYAAQQANHAERQRQRDTAKRPVPEGGGSQPEDSAQGPSELWLQLQGGDYREGNVSWCWNKINDSDVRYVRADLAASLPHPKEPKK